MTASNSAGSASATSAATEVVASATNVTPVCATTTGSTGATAKLCMTQYPTEPLDNSLGLASPVGHFETTVEVNNATSSTVLGCPGQRLEPTLCVTWTMSGSYLATDLWDLGGEQGNPKFPYMFDLWPMFYAAGNKTITATSRIDGKNLAVSVPLTISGLATPKAPSPNSGRVPAVTPKDPTAVTIATVADTAASNSAEKAVGDLMASWAPDMLFYLGDVYQSGTYQEFLNYWHPAPLFGRFNAITAPVVGNHEYRLWGDIRGYRWYWNVLNGGPSGGRAGRWYSFNIGRWHIIVLDSGPMQDTTNTIYAPGTPQHNWLKADLAAHPNSSYPCTMAVWHRPRWSDSSISGDAKLQSLWDLLHPARADVILNAHAHQYERSRPLKLDGSPAADGNGIVQLMVGTGGNALGAWRQAMSSRFVYRVSTYGAMRLVLRSASADFQFVTPRGEVLDRGTIPCR